jgi:hypothetical protein
MKKKNVDKIIFLLFFILSAPALYGQVVMLADDAVLFGDVNGDGRVSIVDALIVAQVYVGIQPEGVVLMNTADVNGDGKLDILDALMIARYYIGMTPSFPIGEIYDQLQSELDEQLIRWSGETAYEYRFIGPDEAGDPVIEYAVHVVGNQVVAVKNITGGEILPEEQHEHFLTIDALFLLFQGALDRKELVVGDLGDPALADYLLIRIGRLDTVIAGDFQGDIAAVILIYFPYQFKSVWYGLF